MDSLTTNIQLSIVATIYNDENIVPILTEEIIKSVQPLNISYEIIYVNDYSSDNSEKAIENETKKFDFVKGISLSRNFGQQIAMSAGIRYATGQYVLIMDGDLQNPPSEIPRLYDKVKEGFDIIYCTSKSRNNFIDRVTSEFFWFVLVKLFKVNIVQNQLMMKIMSKEFAKNYSQYNEINRTVDGIAKDIGLKFDAIEVQNQKRHSGRSHYTFFRRFNLMIDMIISLSNAPLNFMIYLGCTIFAFTSVASIYYLLKYLFYDIAPGFTSIMLALFFFGSVIILMLGFIGRYLANIYSEVRNRPLFHVKKTMNI